MTEAPARRSVATLPPADPPATRWKLPGETVDSRSPDPRLGLALVDLPHDPQNRVRTLPLGQALGHILAHERPVLGVGDLAGAGLDSLNRDRLVEADGLRFDFVRGLRAPAAVGRDLDPGRRGVRGVLDHIPNHLVPDLIEDPSFRVRAEELAPQPLDLASESVARLLQVTECLLQRCVSLQGSNDFVGAHRGGLGVE